MSPAPRGARASRRPLSAPRGVRGAGERWHPPRYTAGGGRAVHRYHGPRTRRRAPMSRRVDPASLGVIVLSLTVSTTALHAEVVELRNGQRIEGKLQQATSAGVFIEVGGRALTFPADQVRAIYYDQAPAVSLRSTSRTASEGVAALQAIRIKLGDGVSSKEYRALLDDLKVKTDAVRADGAVPPKVRSAVDR